MNHENEIGCGSHLRFVEDLCYPCGWSFIAHVHDYFHVFCIKSGEAVFLVDGQECACGQDQVLIVPPGVPHGLVKDATKEPSVVELLFDVSDRFLAEKLVSRGIKNDLDQSLWPLIDRVAVLGNSRVPEMKRSAHYLLSALLTQLAITPKDCDPIALNAQFIDMTGFSDITKAIVVHVDRHYNQAFSLDDLAQDLDYCKSYLCTIFKKDTGITINDYLNLVRISHVAEYLSFVNEDVAYICRQCGFQNTSHFNRTFKKFLGMSPRNFMKVRPPHFNMAILKDREEGVEAAIHGELRSIVDRIGSFDTTL